MCYDIEWLFNKIHESTILSPIPLKYARFHKTLTIMGVYKDLYNFLTDYEDDGEYEEDDYAYFESLLDKRLNHYFIPEIAFYVLCMDNSFWDVKDLFELGDINSHMVYNAFITACRNKYLCLVQWLYKQKTNLSGRAINSDNIAIETQIAIIDKSYSLAKWLYDLLPTNTMKNDIFRTLRNRNYKEVKLFKHYIYKNINI